MSFLELKSLVQDYFQDFPENLLFRTKLIQDYITFRKEYIYFGHNVGEMRHGTYGICFSFAANHNLLIYEGSWANDQYNGKGSLFMIPKPIPGVKQHCRWSQGYWKNGRLNGQGIIKQYIKNNDQKEKQDWEILYRGNFSDNHKHGYGIQSFNGNHYQGQFKLGARNGKGRLTDTLENFYDGKFQKGLPAGEGLHRKGAQIVAKNDNNEQILFCEKKSEDIDAKFFQNVIKLL